MIAKQKSSISCTVFSFTFLCSTFLLLGCSTQSHQSEVIPALVNTTEKKIKGDTVKTVVKSGDQPVKEIRSVAKKKKMLQQVYAVKSISPHSIRAQKSKKVFEFVRVNGELYPVPIPWRGAKVEGKAPPVSEMRQIPVEYTWNKTRLYIRKDACAAFVKMAERAREDDVFLLVHSGFRSMGYQRRIFKKLMSSGRTWEDLIRYVAPPGYSEHVLGTVVDLYPSNWQFASSPAYKWLKKHGADFGFRETYPQRSGSGFPWEAWHWRFMAEEFVAGETVDVTLN